VIAPSADLPPEDPRIALRRDRLLAALTLIAGAGLTIGLPFALKSGAEFFVPTTTALVVSIALIPLLEWLEARHVPSAISALFCVLLFLVAANVALAAIVVPATDFFQLLPSRIGRIQADARPSMTQSGRFGKPGRPFPCAAGMRDFERHL